MLAFTSAVKLIALATSSAVDTLPKSITELVLELKWSVIKMFAVPDKLATSTFDVETAYGFRNCVVIFAVNN